MTETISFDSKHIETELANNSLLEEQASHKCQFSDTFVWKNVYFVVYLCFGTLFIINYTMLAGVCVIWSDLQNIEMFYSGIMSYANAQKYIHMGTHDLIKTDR